MYDVAFTIMDLDSRDRSDLSNIFLNSYLEQTGDWAGLEVLPMYLSRQAYVRAKINSLMLEDPQIPAPEKQTSSKSAVDYYRLAYQYCLRKTAKLILMSGPSGSGKSTVAHYLAQKLNAIHIRSDAVRKNLARIALQEKATEDLYSSQMNHLTYQRLLELGRLALESGFSVILDAKFDRKYWRDLANSELMIYCYAPLDILKERLDKRKNDISDATKDLLELQLSSAQPFTPSEKSHLLVLDTTANWQEQLNKILEEKYYEK